MVNPTNLQQEVPTLMKIIQFDGGAVPNPGTRGIGIILLEDTHVLKEISRKLDGIGTNNEAEYSALIEGLKQALALCWKEILFQGDSRLVVNQVPGSWKVNKDNLKSLNGEAKALLSKFQSVKVEWIPREKNAKADAAASLGLSFIFKTLLVSLSSKASMSLCYLYL